MAKRLLYRCQHPIDEYPFEAFSHGSWRIIYQLKISDGNILMHFESPGLETNDKVPPKGIRLRSRKATLSDCTCFLRPGIDICVLSTLSSTQCSSEGYIKPVLVDAKISSIKRNSHGTRCTCQFYINFYRAQDSLGLGKSTLGKEITMIEIDHIFILQQLDQKPCEDVYYRWSSSKDCPSKEKSRLFRGHFSSDISWLLVTSAWKQVEFCVKSVQNKMVYQILGSDYNMYSFDSEKSMKTLNFHIGDGVLRPSVKDMFNIVPSIPFGTFKVDPVQCDQKDENVSFYDIMDLRRSKRQNVQPERFLGFDESSVAKPCLARSEMAKENRHREERTAFGMSNQDGEGCKAHTCCSRKHIESGQTVPYGGDDSCKHINMNSREEESYLTRPAEIDGKDKTIVAYKRRRKNKRLLGEALLSTEVHKQSTDLAKPSLSNYAEKTCSPLTGVPLPIKTDQQSCQHSHHNFSFPGKFIPEIGKISPKNGHGCIVPGFEKKIMSKDKRKRVETRWDGKGSSRKSQTRHSAYSRRERIYKAKPRKRNFTEGSEYRQLIERCMKNIGIEIQQPLFVAQENEIHETEPLKQARDSNWTFLFSSKAESSELDILWNEMELSMATAHFLESNQDSSVESGVVVKEPSKGQEQSCQHDYRLDEEIGVICQLCSFVSTEIRDILPPFLQSTCWISDKDLTDEKESGWAPAKYRNMDFFWNCSSSNDGTLRKRNMDVLALIPDLRKKLHFHQKRAFEFLWRNIAGSLEQGSIESACKRTGGCVISHSPGSGKRY